MPNQSATAFKTQRVLDPIHGLIVFRAENETDRHAWTLLNTREFQRLRQIRQLGFSEMVFPGATHTRFSHSIGVYHTARKLLKIIQEKLGNKFNAERAQVAAWAALLHDLGHGPFSHTFEGVEKRRGVHKRHEEWTADLILGDTEVHEALRISGHDFAVEIANLLRQSEQNDIYSAVVSSQFDADRLDYLRRDRYMAGVGSGRFDFNWLLDCLEVGKITVGSAESEDDDLVEIDGLYLNNKGLQAAEGYLLARHHLYMQVYAHKTTRGAEQMLGALLAMVSKKIDDDDISSTGLTDTNPLVRYFSAKNPGIARYLALDDVAILSALESLTNAPDCTIAHLAKGLRYRRLYKCFDAGVAALAAGGDLLNRFKLSLQKALPALDLSEGSTLLHDRFTLSAYGVYDFGDRQALQKVLIDSTDKPGSIDDIATQSEVVRAISDRKFYRVYVPDAAAVESVRQIWEELK